MKKPDLRAAVAAAVDAAARAAPGCHVTVVASSHRGRDMVVQVGTTIRDAALAQHHLAAGARALVPAPDAVPRGGVPTGTVH